MPTDTRHVLKFHKDLFRGVDGMDSKIVVAKADAVGNSNLPGNQMYVFANKFSITGTMAESS